MTPRPEREDLLQNLPVDTTNMHHVMDIAHCKIRKIAAVSGNDLIRPYACSSQGRYRHSLCDNTYNYAKNASSGDRQHGNAAGGGLRTIQ